jgi:uncharacterized protein
MSKIMINNTCGKDNVERASLSVVVGKTALASGQEAILLLTIEGVWIATQGYAGGLQAKGFDPLDKLISDFVTAGGQIWVCGACAKPREITDKDLVAGTKIVGAATAVEAMVGGAATLSF